MRILDRERFWAFLKAYCICFVALVGLYVVIDAFTNLDEFAEVSDSTGEFFANMGRYYLIKMSMFYDRLCGVITMMAAIFTVTWMQRNNELLAMLAAGISTRRVIRPVLISAVVVSSLAVINQELIMPQIAAELQKKPDDDGAIKVSVTTREDSNGVELYGHGMADRTFKTVFSFAATIPVSFAEQIVEVQSAQARYIPEDAGCPLNGGWLLHGVRVLTKPTVASEEILIKLGDLKGFPMPMEFPPDRPPLSLAAPLPGDIYFLKSDLTFNAVTRDHQWYQFATTLDLIRALREPYNRPEWNDIEVFLHTRMIRPLAGIALLGLSLPLVLGGQGRNTFINLGMSLATSGVFYAVSFMSQYFGSMGAISPSLAAWAPLIGFSTIAVARWDTIRT
jgi:lipopolysaccharide export system permease protein